jgi:hypothetical protein
MLELLEGLGNTLGKGVNIAFATSVPKINDFTNALGGIPIIGPILSAFGAALQTSIESFRDLANVGANLGGGITDVRNAAAEARLSLDGFRKIVMANSVDLALLEGSTLSGVQTFTRLSSQLQKNLQPRLANLGFGLEETSEYLASYLSIQTRLGRAQTMTDGQLLAGTENYILQLDRLARITGISRKEAEETLKRQTMDKQFRATLAAMTPKVRDEFQMLVATLEKTSPDLAEAAKEFAVSGGTPITDLGKRIALFNGEFGHIVAAFGRGQASFQDVIAAIQRGAKQANGVNKEYARIGTIAAISGNDIALGFTAFTGLENLGKQFTEASIKQRRDLENMAKGVADVERKLLNIRNAIMLALEPALNVFGNVLTDSAGIIDPDGPFMQSLKNFFLAIANGTKEFIEIMNKDGLGAAIKNALSGIGEFLGPILADILTSVFSSPAVITGLILAFGALFTAHAVTSALAALIMKAALGKGPGGMPLPEMPGSKASKLGKIVKGVSLAAVAGYTIDAGVGLVGVGKGDAPDLEQDEKNWQQATFAEKAQSAAPRAIENIAGFIGLSNMANQAKKDRIAAETAYLASKQEKQAVLSKSVDKTAEKLSKAHKQSEIQSLSKALNELDFNKLTIPSAAITSIEIGTNKMKSMRLEINAVTSSFKTLNNTGLDKITKGLERLSGEFKSFNKSFVDDFMTKFFELDKKSQETLLTDLNDKADQLNMHMSTLVTLQQEIMPHVKRTASNTKSTTANMIP